MLNSKTPQKLENYPKGSQPKTFFWQMYKTVLSAVSETFQSACTFANCSTYFGSFFILIGKIGLDMISKYTSFYKMRISKEFWFRCYNACNVPLFTPGKTYHVSAACGADTSNLPPTSSSASFIRVISFIAIITIITIFK